jgi:hypothetical protein
MAGVVDWKLANPEGALQQLSTQPLGSASLDHKPVGLNLASNLSFGGDDAGTLALNARGLLTVTVLNDPADPDEDGILSATATVTPEGELPPQLTIDPARAYVKFRAEAGLKASGAVPIVSLIGIDAGAEATAIFADYRVHPRVDETRSALLVDLASARFVTKQADVLALAPGEALAVRFAGSLDAAVTLSWSDIFTGQIGTFTKLLESAAPIAFTAKAGASVTLSVRVADEFLLVFSRVDDSRWRVGVRKVKSARIAPSVDAGIDVGFANPSELTELTLATLDGLLGAPLERVQSIVSASSLESLGDTEQKIARQLLDRFGLKEEAATTDALRERVAKLQARVSETLEDVVKSRVALSFAYEYSRVSLDTNLLQATLDAAAVKAFHADILKAKTQALTQAIRGRRPGVALELYLNQKTITREHSWGFTLGLGKWATLGGKDFKTISTIRRFDVQGRVLESYLGARLYKGSWVGERTEWGVDLKADMKTYAAEPLVSDYSFGIHLLWTSDQKQLSGGELEQWLDSAIIWRVLREQDVADIRARASKVVGSAATLTVQVVVPNAVLRTTLPALAGAPVDSFTGALAVAMPWMDHSPARTSAARRQEVYAPLWASYLQNPRQSQASFAQAAFARLNATGHSEGAGREVFLTSGPDPFSFGGLTQLNGDTRGACEAFIRGAQILNTAIVSGARNQKTIDKAVKAMDDLWTQSHHVRAIGAYLLECADRARALGDVTRTMTIESPQLAESLIVTA